MHDQKGSSSKTPKCIRSVRNRQAMEGLVQPPNLAGMALSPFVIGAHVIERDVLPPVHHAVEVVHHAGSVAVDFAKRLVSTV